MFFRQIEDFERIFKFLDRVNILVFNVWRDKNAEAFKNGDMHYLESFYRNYISEMREKSNEMLQLKNSIDQQMEDIANDLRELESICQDPEIRGCLMCSASGPLNSKQHLYGQESFVARCGEDIETVAHQRCHKLEMIDSVTSEYVF